MTEEGEEMAEYRKIDWKVQRVGNQLYIRDNVVRKPRFEEDPLIEHGHTRQSEYNQERRRNKEYAQTMNRKYIGFLIMSTLIVFVSAVVYLSQISQTNAKKEQIQQLEAELADMKSGNDEAQSRLETSVNVEEIRRIAMEELGMVFAGKEQVVTYSYEESDYVRQYEEIPR